MTFSKTTWKSWNAYKKSTNKGKRETKKRSKEKVIKKVSNNNTHLNKYERKKKWRTSHSGGRKCLKPSPLDKINRQNKMGENVSHHQSGERELKVVRRNIWEKTKQN